MMKAIKQTSKLYCGIDMSGDTLDICYQTAMGVLEWSKCTNALSGFTEIWKLTGKGYHFIMESTAVYQLPFYFFWRVKKPGIVW